MLSLNNISKKYGQRYIFDDVSLNVKSGEIVGIVDKEAQAIFELVKLMSGQEKPDGGEFLIDDEHIIGQFYPQKHEIGIIRREPQLIESLDIASNLYIGHEPKFKKNWGRWFNLIDRYRIIDDAKELISQLNFALPAINTRVNNLSFEQQQLVAIAQLIIQNPKIVIVDHPGRTLSLPYLEQFFEQIRKWSQQGIAVIIGTSNLDNLFAVCKRIIVLRSGKIVIDSPMQDVNRETVIAALVNEQTKEQVSPVIWALDSYYKALRQSQILQHQQQLLEQNIEQQNSVREQLLKQLSVQVSALDDANLALQNTQRRLLTEREDERKHLARELHDQVIQDLLASNYQLEELVDDYPKVSSEVTAIRQDLQRLIMDIRHICGRLRPPAIDNFGLETTLQSYTHSWSERTGIEVDLQFDTEIGRLSEELELSLFRIIQESLNNTAKHADASFIRVYLTYLNSRMLQLIISDNGIGLSDTFDLGQLSRTGHYGILGITERVALFGGKITFRNHDDGGLQIEVEMPYSSENDKSLQS